MRFDSTRWNTAVWVLLLAVVGVPTVLLVGEWVVSVPPIRLVGLVVLAGVLGLLVYQKRRSRGQQASADAPEDATDREVEGSGEVYAPYAYNNQQKARREGKRIQRRAEEIAEAERERRE